MYKPRVNTTSIESFVVFLPKLLSVSIQTIGNIKRFIIGINNKTTHHFGLLMICIKTIALYTGTIASQGFLPALTYNFQVPKK